MGKVLKKLYEIKAMSNFDILQRYRHILVAQGVKEYLGNKPDVDLNIEVRLLGEEIEKRMVVKRPFIAPVDVKKKNPFHFEVNQHKSPKKPIQTESA